MHSLERLETVRHMLHVIELEVEQVDYVTRECRIKTPSQLRKWSETDIRNAVGDGVKINRNEASAIINLIKWYKAYREMGGDDLHWKRDVTIKHCHMALVLCHMTLTR